MYLYFGFFTAKSKHVWNFLRSKELMQNTKRTP